MIVQITEKSMRELAMVVSNGFTRKTDNVKGITVNSYGLDYDKNDAYNSLVLQAAMDSYDVKEDEYSECVYQNGSTFLYELQKAMGDNEFFYALRVYYKTYYLKEATTEDFLDIIRKVDKSGKVEKIIKKYIK